MQTKPAMSDVVLIVDPMSIYKGTLWDPKERYYIGRVEYGTGLPEADDELATEDMVFMISGISGHRKHPMAYFLESNYAEVLTQLICDSISLVYAEVLNVTVLVLIVPMAFEVQLYNLGLK